MTRKAKVDVTPTLAETIRAVIDRALVELHTAMPAKIITYDHLTQTADVQPALFRMYEGDFIAKPLPIIPSVPVVHPRTKFAHIHMPLTPGDDVLLIFSERSLDRWKLTGMPVDPGDRRRHHLSDCFAIPGGAGLPLSFTVTDPTAIEIDNAVSSIHLKPTGQVKLGGNAATFSAGIAEAISARIAALEAWAIAHMHPTAGVGPPSPPTPPYTPPPTPLGSTLIKVSL